jgi:hypothetical protein
MALIGFKLYDYIEKKKNNVIVPHSVDAIDNENNLLEVVPMPTIIPDQVIRFYFYIDFISLYSTV